jgi:gamma-glutamylcyclotransferase (GGCT)/AIG2-like uncharacterized protein YtfP
MPTLRLLVYGTLRKGENFWWRLEQHIRNKAYNISTVRIHGFEMHVLGSFPGVYIGTNKDWIVAELITIKGLTKEEKESILNILDRIECVSIKLYNRVVVNFLEDGKSRKAIMYTTNIPKRLSIQKINDWRNSRYAKLYPTYNAQELPLITCKIKTPL